MKRNIFFFAGLILVFFAIQPYVWARTLEKKEETDPVLRLREQQREARAEELEEIATLKARIKELDAEIKELDRRIGVVKNTPSPVRSTLDELLDVVTRKEGLLKDLESAEKDLSQRRKKLDEEDEKRREEVETLKADLRKDERKQRATSLKQDLRKYEKIVSSPSVKNMGVEGSAWEALAVKYPKEAKGVKTGDVEELEFRVKYGGITNSVGMRFVLIQSGTFRMGSPETEKFRSDDEIRHKVTIKKPFYIQSTEVTQGQWTKVMGNKPSKFEFCGMDCPVENVSWEDCQEFINKLNALEHTDKYRFPTEAEWEYACRGGRTSAFANGDITQSGCGFDPNLDEMGWYCANSNRKTHPVAGKKMNKYGLYDMHGNVWEWCQDWYGLYPSGNSIDPQGARFGPNRVIRGGSCLNYSERCRSSYRFSYKVNVRMNNIGFRVARTK